jgi:predicted dehydrogenase
VADRIRIGIIGTGFANVVHIPAFQLGPDTEVVAICSGHRENAEKAAETFGIPRVHDDHNALVADPDVDAVAIVTPPVYHAEQSIAALRAGKHVLCEKPTAMNVAEAEAMLAAAGESGRTGMIAHEFRYTATRAFTRALIQDGFIGEPKAINVRMFTQPFIVPRPWGWLADEKMGGGYIFALGSHFIDAIRDWCGEFAGVQGKLATIMPERVKPDGSTAMATADDTFFFHGALAGGALVSVSASTGVNVGSGVAVEIFGSEGTIVLDQGYSLNPQAGHVVRVAKVGDKELRELPIPAEHQPPDSGGDHRLPPFVALVQRFVHAIRTGEEVSPSFVDGLRNQQVIDAVRQSSREGRWVAITPA